MSFTLHQHNWQEIICSSNKNIQLLNKEAQMLLQKISKIVSQSQFPRNWIREEVLDENVFMSKILLS